MSLDKGWDEPLNILEMKIAFNFIGVVAVLCSMGDARADRRAFSFTYEYVTQPKGNLELEFYNTQYRSKFGDDAVSTFEEQIEIEYGITDRTDVSLYQVLEEVDDTGLHYAETKLRFRHRFKERGQLPVDVLLYGELIKPFGKGAVAFEPKLILARDFGAVTAVLNVITELELERELEPSGEKELEVVLETGWAFGVTYEVAPVLKLGGETWGAVIKPGSDDQAVEAWIGPSISWAPSPKLWVTGTAGFGLTDDSDEFLVRILIGLGL